MEDFEKADGKVNENELAGMSKSEREIYMRRLLIESVVIDEQLKVMNDEEPEEGKNFGILTLREFYEKHPEFFEGIDPEMLDNNPAIANSLVAPFGENSFIVINDGMVAGRCENGNFELSEAMKEKIRETPLKEMLMLNKGGRVNDEYLLKFQQNYNSQSLEDRMPDTAEEYFRQVVEGDLVVSRDEFRDTLEISDEDRDYLDEMEREEEANELDENEREYEIDSKEKGDDEEEKQREVEEAEENYINGEIDKTELEKVRDDVTDEAENDGQEIEVSSLEDLEEEKARRKTESVLKRHKIPTNSREQIVDFFMQNEDMDEDSLKQVMEMTVDNKEAYALRFATNSPSLQDRIVLWQDNRIIDKRENDAELEEKMETEESKIPPEVLTGKENKLIYTDMSGNTFVAPLRCHTKDLTDKEAMKVISEFERIKAEEKSILSSRKYPPHIAISKLTEAKEARLDVINKYGLKVPEIKDEITADRETSEEIQDKVNARKDAFIERRMEEKKKAQEENNKEEQEGDDWVRGPYDKHHGMM